MKKIFWAESLSRPKKRIARQPCPTLIDSSRFIFRTGNWLVTHVVQMHDLPARLQAEGHPGPTSADPHSGISSVKLTGLLILYRVNTGQQVSFLRFCFFVFVDFGWPGPLDDLNPRCYLQWACHVVVIQVQENVLVKSVLIETVPVP